MNHFRPIPRTAAWLLLALAASAILVGCASRMSATPPPAPSEAQAPTTEPIIEDEWAAVSIGGAKTGYVHTVVRRGDAADAPVLTTVFSETRIRRFGFNIMLRSTVEYRETPAGALLSATSISTGAGGDSRTECEVRGDKMVMVTTTVGAPHTKDIPWDPEVIGPYAQTRAIRASGMAAGKTVVFKAFIPELHRIAKSTVKMEGPEGMLLDGKTLRLHKGTMLQDILPGLATTVWLDDDGNVIRSLTDALGGVETLRVSREEALRAVAPETIADVMGNFLIKSNLLIPDPPAVTEAIYRLTFSGEAPKLLLDDRRQTVIDRKANEVLLRVRAVGDAPQPAAEKPGPECLAPSPYIQSDDKDIVRVASQVTAGLTTPEAKARRLEEWVFRNITQKDYSIGFASAKETLLSREGDCTEHSVLLAALLRAAGVPSRVAVGVTYWKGSFAYHMWTEAFLNDWTALDATLHTGVVDATHIRFTVTPLDNASAADPFLSLVPVIGKTKITVEKVSP